MSDYERMYFEPYPLFSAELTHNVEPWDCGLPLETQKAIKLCEFLGKDCYTYLTLGDGCHFEVVRAQLTKGYLTIERACDGSQARAWPCGTCIEFHMVKCALHDMINQAVPAPPEEEMEPAGYNGTMCVGRWDYHFKNGWLSHRECNNNRIPHSYVENPVLCFDEDGCMTEAGEGSNRVAVNRCG